MGGTIQDFRYGLRGLLKRPGFSFIIVLTLALGIGANTAIFSAVHAVLLSPLPYPQPDRLIVVGTISPQTSNPSTDMQDNCSYLDMQDWRARNHSFEEMAIFRSSSATLTSLGEPERIQCAVASAGFLDVLGVNPALGRWFLPEEDKPGSEHVVILSYSFWQNRLGGVPNILDQSLGLGGRSYRIVGVMPESFKFPLELGQDELWEPLADESTFLTQRSVRYYSTIARIKPGVSVDQAQAELNQIEQALAQQYPEDVRGRRIQLAGLRDLLVGDVRLALWMILSAVGFVLLIACSNVANLLLARASGRQKEIAIRSALGAGRMRIVKQLLSENMILALAGGAAGLALASFSIDPLLKLSPQDIPRLDTIRTDATVFAFAVGVSLVCGLLFGLAPALRLAKPDLSESLKEGGRASSGSHAGGRLRAMLGIAEIALSIMLLAGAGLLVKSFLRITRVNPGFDEKNLLQLTASLPSTTYGTPEQRLNRFLDILDRMRALPGAKSAALGLAVPFNQIDLETTLGVEGRPKPLPEDRLKAAVTAVSPTYFETLGIPMKAGRPFSDFDRLGHVGVAVINQEAADRYWPGQDPIGQFITVGLHIEKDEPQRWQVVGIAGNVHDSALDVRQIPTVYLPIEQQLWFQATILIRTQSDPMGLAGAARAQITAAVPGEPVSKISSMEQVISTTVSHPRFYMVLVGIFASVGLVLALIGIYGIMSYSVQERCHEIGVRMALGADARQVIAMVMRRGIFLVSIGLASGLLGALGIGKLMIKLLFDVSPADPINMVAVSGLLVLTALLACYIPARRATRIDPMVALRTE